MVQTLCQSVDPKSRVEHSSYRARPAGQFRSGVGKPFIMLAVVFQYLADGRDERPIRFSFHHFL